MNMMSRYKISFFLRKGTEMTLSSKTLTLKSNQKKKKNLTFKTKQPIIQIRGQIPY